MSDRQFLLRVWATLSVMWLLVLPLGFFAWEPVIAATFILVFGSLFEAAILVIWRRPRVEP